MIRFMNGGGINLYGFVGNDSLNQLDLLGHEIKHPEPSCLISFEKEGQPCCCDDPPKVLGTMVESGTAAWTIRIKAEIIYSGCVTEVRWAWTSCVRYKTPFSKPESGYFLDYGCNKTDFTETLFPAAGILNMWISVRWLECSGKPGVWKSKSKTLNLSYEGNAKWWRHTK